MQKNIVYSLVEIHLGFLKALIGKKQQTRKESFAIFLNQKSSLKELTKGYATYWNAYNNVIYSNFDLEIGAVRIDYNDIQPRYWLADADYFSVDKNLDKSFLILIGSELENYHYAIQSLGEPLEIFEYDNLIVYITTIYCWIMKIILGFTDLLKGFLYVLFDQSHDTKSCINWISTQ